MTEDKSRPTLRDLPLPAKLVVTAFLFSVGLGYCWAMLQLHFKHASGGNLLPTASDAIARFSGQRAPWEKDEEPQANGNGNGKPAEVKPEPKVEPKGDGRRLDRRDAKGPEPKVEPKAGPKMVAGIRIKQLIVDRCAQCHGADGEKDDIPIDTYANIKKLLDDVPQKGKIHKAINKENDDAFGKDNMVQAFTRKSFGKIDNVVFEWKDLIKMDPNREAALRAERETERKAMVAWIEAGAPEKAFNDDAFPLPEELRGKPLTPEYRIDAPELAREDAPRKKKDPKQCQLSVESLTQSTHAHLLSFSLLWAATGLIFAFTSYSYFLRCTLAPAVLIVQVIDICCWWLARLPEVGPYFALAVMGTGAIVGIGLVLQILLSLFNMYGGKGKFVILLLLLSGGAAGGVVYSKYIAPMVAEEKQDAAK